MTKESLKILKSSISDIEDILKLIKEAKNYFAINNINQWQTEYPEKKDIEKDIFKGESYIVKNNENKIIATAMISYNNEPTYAKIKGKWLFNDKYVVVHRIAISDKFKRHGLASFILLKTIEMARKKGVFSFRIDTHPDNKAMHNLIKKMNFTYCGIINVEDGSERLAFEMKI